MNVASLAALKHLRAIWAKEGDGPLVTMDAGANVHILLRPEQTESADRWLTGIEHLKSWT